MKNLIKSTTSLLLALIFVFSLAACGKINTDETPDVTNEDTTAVLNGETEASAGLWADAVYTEDTELGTGEKAVTVEVKAEDKTITFTVNTDAATVGAALLELDLIAGDESEYGLYVKKVNGIVADYDIDQSYWAFYIDGEYAMSGVDSTEITEGAVYQLAYTK